MSSLFDLQRWLYAGIAGNLDGVATRNLWTLVSAMAAAMVFGAVHALMPGHGKAVLVSYYLGRTCDLRQGLLSGLILALTHVGIAVVLVLAGVVVISRAFAVGGRTPAFETASAAMITLIGAFLLWRALRSAQHGHERDGRALAFVTGLVPCPLTTFIMTYALVRGVLGLGLIVTAAMAVGMVATIGGFAMVTILARERCVLLLARTETWRSRLGKALEIIGAIAVLVLGALPLIHQFGL
jgi:ABC-type nickel/cobalt efflux system permease component RcnA